MFIRRDIPSRFSFQENRDSSYDGEPLEKNDALFNLTDIENLSMNDKVPWRGPREKNLPFMRDLILQFCKPGDIVLDCKAATGTFLSTI